MIEARVDDLSRGMHTLTALLDTLTEIQRCLYGTPLPGYKLEIIDQFVRTGPGQMGIAGAFKLTVHTGDRSGLERTIGKS